MEKSNNVAVVKVPIQWNDLGSYNAISNLFPKDLSGNSACSENHHLKDTSETFIISDDNKTILTIGLNNLIVVNMGDALLISDKNKIHLLKELLDSKNIR